MTHTPGPWRILSGFPEVIVMDGHEHRSHGGSIHEADDRDRFALVIATASHNDHSGFAHEISKHTTRANARLIAAAPEMLEALRAIDVDGKDANANGDVIIKSEIWDLVQQALGKATGDA